MKTGRTDGNITILNLAEVCWVWWFGDGNSRPSISNCGVGSVSATFVGHGWNEKKADSFKTFGTIPGEANLSILALGVLLAMFCNLNIPCSPGVK
ncbi:hypothetical protein VFPPC_15518 [Pochonia chlamydosporia 170]|uniref:Uncharacterized protein n=1 Tax=Pochonia chlamydosporia 170 TaxID=1380566 RepID=A0A179FWG1_METCM|nr:hypothetical protein VFPPC_15518 [Pochonia chlamydosporia 170]OAQ69995.2 hypothetical protein VFPPC_15518 [Pochonia chlamydosporia 170]